MRKRGVLLVLLGVFLLASGGVCRIASAQTFSKRVQHGGRHLAVDLVDDHVIHFQMGHRAIGPQIQRSLMVLPDNEAGLGHVSGAKIGPKSVQGTQLRVDFDPEARCLTLTRAGDTSPTTRLCLRPHGHLGTTLAIDQLGVKNLYGLGEQFNDPGVTDGDWLGRWRAGGPYGNDMVNFSGGMVGNAQFPVLYALGGGKETFALIIDEPRKLSWDATQTPFLVSSPTDTLRGYLIVGDGLPSVRRQVMALTGRAVVPPKSAFGLWISKYGFRSWEEVQGEVTAMRKADIPVDGAVLDLFWFGGVDGAGPKTKMGTLQWDPNHFASPKEHITALKQKLGIDLMVIEEGYVGERLPEHDMLAKRGDLVTLCGGSTPAPVVNDSTVYDRPNPKTDAWFWGRGGMIDWTRPQTRSFWHETKRAPLVDAGVSGFWTDLSEPRMFNVDGCYTGNVGFMPAPARQQDVHNLYALLWHQGIAEGMAKHTLPGTQDSPRPFILSRSGTLGIARYGAAMWSGDIGSNLPSLAAHMNAQMHLSLSGVDYYGTDVGGFWRSGLDSDDVGALFSTWLANSTMLDVPVRPHTMDTQNTRSTNPAKLGDVVGNRDAIRLRYMLIPYLYSQAHRAWRHGDAVFAPLVYAFQEDPNTRQLGSQKMLGDSLMVATVTHYDAPTRDVYLPAGDWFDWHTLAPLHSEGEWLREVSAAYRGHTRLPMYARAGSVMPLLPVDDGVLHASGQRKDGSVDTTLKARIFAGAAATEATLYEDDASTTAYQRGAVRQTVLRQAPTPDAAGIQVTIDAAQGSYKGAPDTRRHHVEIVTPRAVKQVLVDGKELPKRLPSAQLAAAGEGWYEEGGMVHVRLAARAVQTAVKINAVFTAQATTASPS